MAISAYIATVSGIFETAPQSWSAVLQIHSCSGPMT
jgi:hypothetical protein